MKHLQNLVLAALAATLLASCATPANIAYFQDVNDRTDLTPAQVQTIRLKPMDQISVIVNSRDPRAPRCSTSPTTPSASGRTRL